MNKMNILNKQQIKSFLLGMMFTSIVFSLVVIFTSFRAGVFAEQTGQTPDSLVTSRIKQAYEMVSSLGYGSEVSSSLGDWGAVWNRLISAAEWTPEGDVQAANVVSGKTFYNNSRTPEIGTLTLTGDATELDVVSGKTFYSDTFALLTGSAPAPIDYSLQSLNLVDDYGTLEYSDDEATWELITSGVWKDGRTGLYWTNSQGLKSNNFSQIDCDFFTSVPRGSYDGNDNDCGVTIDLNPHAINYCAKLDFGGRTDWYLPSQKELMQAYIDGIYNATPFIGRIWSSTEASYDSSAAWGVYFDGGDFNNISKNNPSSVRCVARD